MLGSGRPSFLARACFGGRSNYGPVDPIVQLFTPDLAVRQLLDPYAMLSWHPTSSDPLLHYLVATQVERARDGAKRAEAFDSFVDSVHALIIR
jgi:hypothetical protein